MVLKMRVEGSWGYPPWIVMFDFLHEKQKEFNENLFNSPTTGTKYSWCERERKKRDKMEGRGVKKNSGHDER